LFIPKKLVTICQEIEIVSSLDPADDSIEVIQEEDFELSSEPAGGIVMTHSTASGSQLSSLSKDKTSVAEVRDEMDSWVIQGKETEEDLGNLDDEFAKIMATARKMEEKTKQRGDSDSVPSESLFEVMKFIPMIRFVGMTLFF
jgi:hypothetical protein